MKTLLSSLLTIVLVAFATVLFSHCSSSSENEALNQKVIVGYVAGWAPANIEEINLQPLTHVNYAFANIRQGMVVLESRMDSVNLTKLVALKELYPHVKILISVGGWSWSDGFSDAAFTPQSRSVFAQSAVDLMLKYKLDGIDLDWEYPGQLGEDNIFRVEDKQNFTLMLKEVRHQLDVIQEKSGTHYILTIAAGADQKYINNTEMAQVQNYLDFVNLMTYDFYGGWSPTTGHHANLFPSSHVPELSGSIQQSVDLFLAAGVPAEKLVVGVPFYGKMWTGVNPVNNGLYQNADKNAISVDYKTTVKLMQQPGFKRYMDESAQAPYLWDADSLRFVTIEDSASLVLKTNFVKQRGLKGVMFWEYSQDSKNVLMNTLSEQLKE
jgi:chitinase